MDGPAFYDDDTVFQTYVGRRERVDNANDTLEKPVLLELIGQVGGLRVLDLGCGDAVIGREILERGAQAYVGVDGSHNMVELARQALAGTSGEIVQADMQTWEYPQAAFDLTLSRLALHYLSDAELEHVLARIFDALRPGGRLVFSVEHPVITSCDRGWETGVRQAWLVDDYFNTGRRVTEWMGGQAVKYHRTVEGYYGMLQAAGFEILSLRESHPQREWFQDADVYERRKRIPLFLFLMATKP